MRTEATSIGARASAPRWWQRIVEAAREGRLRPAQPRDRHGATITSLPARSTRRFGFVAIAQAFADYPADSPHNCYMTLALQEP